MDFKKRIITDGETIIDKELLEYMEDGIVEAINTADNKADKSEIPTKTSQLTNDSNFLTSIPSEYVKTVNGIAPNQNGDVTISATIEPPPVVDSIEEMVDTSKQYVLSTDGFVYAYKEVNADGEQVPNFTNLADVTSNDWLTDVRLSTSATSSQSGSYVTNYIPCSAGDIIRVKGMDITYYGDSTGMKSRLHVLTSDKTLVVSDCGYMTYLIDSGYASSNGEITTVTAGWAGATAAALKSYSTTAYERFCGHLLDGYTLDDVIITVNEEITYISSSGSEYKWVSTGISSLYALYFSSSSVHVNKNCIINNLSVYRRGDL